MSVCARLALSLATISSREALYPKTNKHWTIYMMRAHPNHTAKLQRSETDARSSQFCLPAAAHLLNPATRDWVAMETN